MKKEDERHRFFGVTLLIIREKTLMTAYLDLYYLVPLRKSKDFILLYSVHFEYYDL